MLDGYSIAFIHTSKQKSHNLLYYRRKGVVIWRHGIGSIILTVGIGFRNNHIQICNKYINNTHMRA